MGNRKRYENIEEFRTYREVEKYFARMQVLDNKKQTRTPFIQGYSQIDENPRWMAENDSDQMRKLRKEIEQQRLEKIKEHESEQYNDKMALLSIIDDSIDDTTKYNLNDALSKLSSGTVRRRSYSDSRSYKCLFR